MKGIITALLTPFNKDGTLHEAGIREVVRYNIDEMNVNGLYVGGSTGESFLMDECARKQLLHIVKDEAGDDVSLIAQIGSLDIDEAERLGKAAKKLDYDALSAITPYYYKFSYSEIKAYYERLAAVTDHAMIIYSNPAFTGAQFSIKEYSELLALPNVIGVKYTDTDLSKLSKLKNLHRDKVFFSGVDDMLLPFAVSGSDGAIGSTYNIIGRKAKALYEAVQNSNMTKAQQLQSEMNEVIEQLETIGVYPAIKHILKQFHVDAGFMKFTFKELTADERAEAEKITEMISA